MSDVNREHKDRLFAFIFGREEHKDWALSLYNAVNGTDHADCDELEFTTIGEALYLSMKNDVSLLIQPYMELYEQQSSYNPNMPVRFLMYLGKLYDKYIKGHKLNIYGSVQQILPVPRCVVFYNGLTAKPDETFLYLSDAFHKDGDRSLSDVELKVRMLNINYGHNAELMKLCEPLMEYSWLVDEIRKNRQSMELEDAVDKAVTNMPKDFRIRELIVANKAEVRDMCITEYDEEEVKELFKAEGRTEGGEYTIIGQIIKKLNKGKEADEIAEAIEEPLDTVESIIDVIKSFGDKPYDAEGVWKAWRGIA